MGDTRSGEADKGFPQVGLMPVFHLCFWRLVVAVAVLMWSGVGAEMTENSESVLGVRGYLESVAMRLRDGGLMGHTTEATGVILPSMARLGDGADLGMSGCVRWEVERMGPRWDR